MSEDAAFHPVLPEVLRIERDPATGDTRLFIDGQPFPWTFATDDAAPVSYDLVGGQPPSVRLTLVARSVEVVDRMLVGIDLGVDHTPVEPEPEPTPVSPGVPGDHSPADLTATEVRCAECDELWPCRKEQLRIELTGT